MKHLLVFAALYIATAAAPGVAYCSNVCAESAVAASSTQKVKAFKPLKGGGKVNIYLTVSWDGNECWVLAKGSQELKTPVKASYDRTYSGYPYRVTISGETYYFAL